MNQFTSIELRSALPIETRDEGDPAAAAVAAVNELRTAVDAHRTATDERIATEIRTITSRLDDIEVRSQRPGGGTETTDEATELQTRAFDHYLRGGREALSAEETRALEVGDGTGGATLVPEHFIAEMIRNLVLFSPVRQLARVSQAASTNVKLPRRTAALQGGWVAEGDPNTPSEPTYGAHSIEIFEARVHTDISNALLEDAAFDMAGELARDFAEEFARLEGLAFVNGNGTTQPEGFITSGDFVTGAGDSDFADAIVDLYHAVPSVFAGRGAWAMNRSTMGAVRKLKTSGTGVYLWADSLSPDNPPTLLGRPVVEFPDLPDVGQSPAGTPIIFGDWMTAYRVFDRVGLSVLRDPYSRATNSEVRFLARRRVGGKLVQPAAIRGLQR